MTDLISRADVMAEFREYVKWANENGETPTWNDAVSLIGSLPSAEPKGDLISRADAIERIVNDNVVGGMDRINEYRNSNEHNDYLDGISCAIATVDDVPSAETHEIRTETHGVCLISKDDAMGAVQDHFNADGFKGYDDGQKMMDRIKALPSAEAEWIPCSERLPNEDGRYLVVYPLIGGGNWISIKWFGKPNMPNRPIKGKCFYESDSEYGDVIWDDVLAWMPLPMPYREDGE